jgi:hypothetical protein
MNIDGGAFALVFTVSVSATAVVVVLVSVALLEISTRYRSTHGHPGHTLLSSRLGNVVGAGCILAAVALVVFGLWQLVAGS